MALEEKLIELQCNSSDMSDSKLLCYKANIQATARSKENDNMSLLSCFILIGELNKEFVAQDDKEVYFRLWKQLGMASTLTEFSANSNTIDSIILGAHACSCNSRNAQPIYIYM